MSKPTPEVLSVRIEALDEARKAAAHDVRAPLRAMRSTAAILLEDFEGHLTEEQSQMLTRLDENARKLEQVIETLLQACSRVVS